MAQINDNLLVRGARGNVGKQFVYKKRGEGTHIAKMPSINKDQEVTPNQVKVRELFAEAALYAKGAITSPDLKKEYEKKATPGTSAYNMAFRDFLKPPVVKSINAVAYRGQEEAEIVIKAKDDFRVVDVLVEIHTSAGVLVETGIAMLDPIDRGKWIYLTKLTNTTYANGTITATAYDIPGNSATLKITI